MRSGFIAIIGKPNAGKSSLTNRLTGEKISIVTPKPQTTRDAVRAILTTSEYQMIFVDTPGLLKPRTELGKYMSRETDTSSRDADALVIVIDGSRPFGSRDYEMIESRLKSAVPVYVVINKTDIAGYEKVYPNNYKAIKTLNPPKVRRSHEKRIRTYHFCIYKNNRYAYRIKPDKNML